MAVEIFAKDKKQQKTAKNGKLCAVVYGVTAFQPYI
ncbi:MAG: hypothetical protein ACI8SJ_002591 [Shewanella sp.]|jgi:hypothetical protein